jgi:hypothetical protein
MRRNRRGRIGWRIPIEVWAFAALVSLGILAHGAEARGCRKIALEGEVSAGQEWKTPIGEGWVFRLVPIVPGKTGYSGWDLTVDRERPAGYPDALLLATPPYGSIGEREVGTTFGLRAQDAIGWNPRSFRFLTLPEDFREGRALFQTLGTAGASGRADAPAAKALKRLMELAGRSSPGEFRILDARLAPGVADAAPFAESWALAAGRTAHTVEPSASGKSTPQGELHWMRFSIALWLPAGWKAPRQVQATMGSCSR